MPGVRDAKHVAVLLLDCLDLLYPSMAQLLLRNTLEGTCDLHVTVNCCLVHVCRRARRRC